MMGYARLNYGENDHELFGATTNRKDSITDARMKTLRQLEIENTELREKIALAYGYLWHVNNEPMAPVPTYSPERAAYDARKILRDTMTHEQRGDAINHVQSLLGHNAKVRGAP